MTIKKVHLGLAAIAAVLLATSSARADLEWLAVRLEGGGNYMLSEHQRDVLGYELGGQVLGRVGFMPFDPITIQVAAGSYWFPSDDGLGQLIVAGGGLRLEPLLGDVVRLWVDGDALYTRTGDFDRFGVDVGVGLEFVAGVFSVGPYMRYLHVLAQDENDGGDAMILVFGLSVALHGEYGPGDRDADGVRDPDDVCPSVPAGDNPDPQRIGCPLEDGDHDGVNNRDDICPTEPMGDAPDPQRRGCPIGDGDGDGVNDRDDLCPTEPAGDRADPERAGCPLPDSDFDGVYDPDDQCPTTHQSPYPDPTRAGCPDPDEDGDGVRNATDECRTQHSGYHPDPDRLGCPLADGDNDSVPDVNDACPTRPGAPSQNPRRNGCPSLVRLEVDRIVIERPVFFATNADRILPRSNGVLNALVDALLAVPQIRRVSIEGHTDDVGDDAANLDLSNRRAANVMQWLIDHGVEASRLEAHGFGETRPLVEGTSRRARGENRRVEFRVLDPAPPEAGQPAP